MEPYQERVVAELQELQDRLQKLTAFNQSDRFRALPEAEQNRMLRQAQLMDELATVLSERIANF